MLNSKEILIGSDSELGVITNNTELNDAIDRFSDYVMYT